MSQAPEHPKRTGIVVRRFDSSVEADEHDLEYWQQIPDAERVRQVWRLSCEQWVLHGHEPYEPGLSRSVVRVIRNKRATGRPKDLADIAGLRNPHED